METLHSRRAALMKKHDEPIIQRSGADEPKQPLISPPSTITIMLFLFALFHVGDASLSAGQASLLHGENRVGGLCDLKSDQGHWPQEKTDGFSRNETLSPTFGIFRSFFYSYVSNPISTLISFISISLSLLPRFLGLNSLLPFPQK